LEASTSTGSDEALAEEAGAGSAAERWKGLLRDGQAALVIAALIAANYMLFRSVFGTNYFRWYLDNGTILGLILATAAVGLNLDAEDGLISSRPARYLMSWALIIANLWIQLAAVMVDPETLEQKRRERQEQQAAEERESVPARGGLSRVAYAVWVGFAMIVTLVFMGLGLTMLVIVGVIVAMAVWLLVVAPLQYFLYVVCGGPARTFKGTVWSDARLPKGSLAFVEHVPEAPVNESDAKGYDPDSGGRWQTVYSARPVTFTTSVGVVVLFILSRTI
jgi:hypothetical protein